MLATSTLNQKKAKNMLISVEGEIGAGVTSKDIVLHICGVIGTAGGTGVTIEFGGSAIRALSMEVRALRPRAPPHRARPVAAAVLAA